MAWRKGEYYCNLFVDMNFKKATIKYFNPKTRIKLNMTC